MLIGNVDLILHGEESLNLGGPSTRVPRMAEKLRSLGVECVVARKTTSKSGLSHVFNVWPPQSCMDAIEYSKKYGRKVVLSPIFLNLSEHKIYEQLVPALYEGLSGEQLESSLLEVKNYIENSSSSPIFEPVDGYYKDIATLIDKVDYLVLLSNHERQCLDDIQALNSKPFKIIHNPAHQINAPKNDRGVIKESLNLDSFFLQIGRIEPRKNQLLLAESARRLNVPAVFLGAEGDPNYAKLVRKIAGPMGIFTGRISQDDPLFAALIHNALAICLPSWAEGAPLAALEGAGVGAQLILSDQSGEIEYFGDRASYINPADINAMMMNMEAAMKRGRPFRDAGLINMAAREFNWDSHIQQTLDVYCSL